MSKLNVDIVVKDVVQKVRLDVFLASETDWTRSQIKQQIDAGNALVNGISRKAGFLVKDGDLLSLTFDKQELSTSPEDIALDIVYEDDDLAVINKPQGMVVHPAPGSPNHTLVNALLFHFENLSSKQSIRPGIVHRIDKDTSGLLVVAKNEFAHASLAAQIGEHSCFRKYYALLEGNLQDDEGTIETFIARSKTDRKMMEVASTGKRAVTHFKVLERYKDYCFVQFVLETGRTHQIRVHSKYLGHPVVGDKTYGKPSKFKLSGQLLHAAELSFTHPRTHEKMTFSCSLPEYFQNILNKIKNSKI